MNGLDGILPEGAQLNQQVPVLRQNVLARASITFEKGPEGAVHMHLDVLWSPHGAERFTVPFDAQGWEAFLIHAQNAGTSIEIAKPRILP